ncbi:hypothetical protein [Uliginosibacterium gangwonense]|uniref:hypothetical protein n=1 Tax=Uliginosibacterium gangwonense TaxID=392736 RepID=UPI0003714998|nr:hypothetical protein [Uliginosibacterium gangwonense]
MSWFARHPPVITLDFVPRRRWPSLLGWLILGSGGLIAMAVLTEFWDLGDQLVSAQARLARETRHLERSRHQELAKQQEKLPEAELARAVELAQRLHNHKLDVLTEIEAACNKDVTLLALVQSDDKLQLKLTGQARSLEAAFAFARRLAASPRMIRADVDGYEFKPSGSVESVVFSMNVAWRATP